MSNKQFQSAFELAQEKVRALITNHPGYYPMYTVNGKWKHSGETWTHWCDGFLPGQMWIFYEKTRSEFWLEKAIEYSKPLEPRQFDRDVHDLGFIFCSTYLRWLEALEDQRRPDRKLIRHVEDVLIQAGLTMSLRFNKKGKFLRSFLAPDSLFIDIMMNVGIILVASNLLQKRRKGKDARALWEIAYSHCQTSMRTLVRGDGSTAHEAIFDLKSGECLRQSTQQGFRHDSSWSRGLAWAAYGFAYVSELTESREFLRTAEMCAQFYMDYTPEHGVPPWDYDAQPAQARKTEDSSAAAIMAAGLHCLQMPALIAGHNPQQFSDYSKRIMKTLCSRKYLGTAGSEGILKHGIYHIHKNLGVDESVMWGEYFFVEALSKMLPFKSHD